MSFFYLTVWLIPSREQQLRWLATSPWSWFSWDWLAFVSVQPGTCFEAGLCLCACMQFFCFINNLKYRWMSHKYTQIFVPLFVDGIFINLLSSIHGYAALLSVVAFVCFSVVWQALCTPFASEGQLLRLHPAGAEREAVSRNHILFWQRQSECWIVGFLC